MIRGSSWKIVCIQALRREHSKSTLWERSFRYSSNRWPVWTYYYSVTYYSVKIHPDFKKCFKFSYKGTLYKYRALPNGLCTCPRKFTKMMKPPLAVLRQCGHIIHTVSGYIDGQYLQGKTQQKCIPNATERLRLCIVKNSSIYQ